MLDQRDGRPINELDLARPATVVDKSDARWLVPVGASVPGHSHLAVGEGGQDAWRVARGPDDRTLCLVVADGAGTRSRSAEGAHLAAALAAGLLERYLVRLPDSPRAWRELLELVMRHIRARFIKDAVGRGQDGDPRPFATTLTFAIVVHPWVGIASVGNCFAVARTTVDAGSGFHLVLEPPPPVGEYASGTTFLTSDDALDLARYRVLHSPDLDGLALCSDGCIESAVMYLDGAPSRPNPPFFAKVFAAADEGGRAASRLLPLLSTGVVAASDGDDKTVVAVARRAEAWR